MKYFETRKVIDAQSVAPGGSYNSAAISDAGRFSYINFFYYTTGTGTPSVVAQGSWDGGANWTDISPAKTAASGIVELTTGGPPQATANAIAPLVRLRVRETGGANGLTYTAHFYGRE